MFTRTAGSGRRNQDSYEAVWEHANNRKLVYSKPRYDAPVIFDPDSFDWTPAGKGVARKPLGIFTERETRIETIRLAAGAEWKARAGKAVRLIFVMSGKGKCGSDAYDRHALIELGSGEAASFRAEKETELLVLAMPLIGAAAGRKPA